MKQFWIINIGRADVHLSDLDICIPAGKYLNLMALNHDITEQDIRDSEMKGSIATNVASRRIMVNYSEPKFTAKNKLKTYNKPWQLRHRVAQKAIVIEEPDLLFNEEVERHAEKIAAMLAGDDDE